jgi:hypothetical protein
MGASEMRLLFLFSYYFQVSTSNPTIIQLAPTPTFQVNCSFKNKKDKVSVIKILALSIKATSETLPILMAL